MKKYKLTRIKVKAKLNDKEVTLYRIRALTNIYNSVGTLIVGEGHLGGFVEGEENLSQFGSCWIADNSMVFGGAKVQDYALIKDSAIACQDSLLTNSVIVGDCAQIKNSIVSDFARVGGNTKIENESNISDSVCIDGDCKVAKSKIGNNVKISGKVCIDDSMIRDKVTIFGENANINRSVICAWAKLEGEFKISRSYISGNANINGKTKIKNAEIESHAHISGESELEGEEVLRIIIDDNAEIIDSTIKGEYIIKNNAKIIGERLVNSEKHTEVISYTNALYTDLE